ncbi:MAG: Rdx family protein [Chloroflexota bacterium]|nr:Rdx family protein [Chloroflexota bacterium]
MSEKQIAIEVVYCADCGYWPRTSWMLGELMTDIQHLVSDVKLIPDTKGLFEWSVNGDLVFSKAAMGRFPDMDELRELIYSRLD